MLGSIFHKRKKPQDLRTPSLQDIKRFRDTYARHAARRCVEPPACLERSVYKAISSQRELHSLDFRQEDITDPQLIALAETLLELPLISSLDLRDNRITDDGAKALLEVLRLQIIAAKTPVPCDPKTKKPLYPQVPEYTKYVTSVNLRGNEVSAEVQQELAQYTAILRREDKRLEIRAVLAQMDRDSGGGIDEDEFKGVLKLLTGAEPSKRDLRSILQQHSLASDSAQGALSLENVLLARCSSPTSNKAASPPWEALVQVRHAILGPSAGAGAEMTGKQSTDMIVGRTGLPAMSAYSETSAPPRPSHVRMPSPVTSARSTERFESDTRVRADSEVSMATPQHSSLNVRLDETPTSSLAVTPTVRSLSLTSPPPTQPVIPPLVFAPPSPDKRRGSINSARSSSVAPEEDGAPSSSRGSLTRQLSSGQSRGFLHSDRAFTLSASSASSPHQPEPLDSLRSTTPSHPTSHLAKRAGLDESDKSPAPSHDRKIEDSPRFDQDDGTEGLGNSNESEIFGNDSSADDILLSALSQSSTCDSRKCESASSSASHSNTTVARSVSEQPSFDIGSGGVYEGPGFPEHGEVRDTTEKSASRADEHPQSGVEGVNEWQSDEFSHDNSDWLGDKDGGEDYAAPEQVAGTAIGPAFAAVDSKSEVSDDDDEEEHVDVVDAEVVKDGKPRTVMKLVHTAFKSGLKLTEFPSELPLRNLLVLILSDNMLRDLTLFEECRFPCVIVLDLSRNQLAKLPDKALAVFPKLQVLDMAHNQLRFISGVLESFKLRALNVSHNSIRSVTNIEHLVFLEVLTLSGNSITAAQSLRLLSLNKMLSHIDLDANPIVDTDERQRRKNIAYILNLVPTLASLGSIACASLQSKEKKKKAATAANGGASLFDASYFPEMESAWVKRTCDLLACVQDKPTESFRDRERDEDDADEDGEGGGSANNVKKPLNRAQQRQKDEVRSRAVAYRSRGKAPPSPPKTKTSVYSFGAPLSPPPPRKAKKPANPPSDPVAVRRQLRRSSELSAPKHAPVDTALLKQEQKRKSRPAFDLNMSVAERLLLAKEQAQRRSSSTVVKRSNSSKRQANRDPSAGTASTEGREATRGESGSNAPTNQQDTGLAGSKPGSPRNLSPTKEVVAFRIEPLSSIRRQDVLEFRVEPPRPAAASTPRSSAKAQAEQESESPTSSCGLAASVIPTKDDNFLRSLVVDDFLSHAAEELSTALTALNVLLSMCEKELRDRNKLNGYRASLEALGILDELESHALYGKTRAFGARDQEARCAEAFERLGLVKRCMRQLLEKLHDHEPGSAVIRAFCRSMRSVELRSVLSDFGEPSLEARSRERDSQEKPSSSGSSSFETHEAVNQPQPSPANANARLFGSPARESGENVSPRVDHKESAEPSVAVASEANDDANESLELGADINLDFLEPTTSVFDADVAASVFDMNDVLVNPVASGESDAFLAASKPDKTLHEAVSTLEAALLESPSAKLEESTASSSYPVTSDITFDIQMESDANAFDVDGMELDAELDLLADADEKPDQGASVDSPSKDLTAEEPAAGAILGDDWLGGATTTDTADADAQESILQSEDSAIKWGDNHEPQEMLEEIGDAAGDAEFVDGDADIAQGEACAEETWNEQHHFEVQADNDVGNTEAVEDTRDYEETEELESSEIPDEYQGKAPAGYQDDAGVSVEATAEYEEPGPADEGTDATYGEAEEEPTEPTDETQAAELATGEDADDEEAEMFGDWEKGFDPNSNHYFWFNHATGESSWEPPGGWPFEVDEPFEAEGEYVADGDEAVEQPGANVNEAVYSNSIGDEGVESGEYTATESGEEAGSHDDAAMRASEFEPSRVSEFEFDDSDLPTF